MTDTPPEKPVEKPVEDLVEETYADREGDPDVYEPEDGAFSGDTHTVYDKYGEIQRTPHDDEVLTEEES